MNHLKVSNFDRIFYRILMLRKEKDMNKEDQGRTRPEEHRYGEYEDEIQLIDLIRVLWKWKWLIIAGTLALALVAGVISFHMPKVYEIVMAIEPGIIEKTEDGKFIYLDSAENISRKIKEAIYNQRIATFLKIDPLEHAFKFTANAGKKASLIKIRSEWQEEKIDIGLQAFRQLAVLLAADYENVVQQKKTSYDSQIFAQQNEISKIEIQRKDIEKQIFIRQNEIGSIEIQRKDIDKQIAFKLNDIERNNDRIKLEEANLTNLRKRKEELTQEIKEVKQNTEKIVQQRDLLLKDRKTGDDISLLLYSTTIQQNVAYFNQLSSQIYNLNNREDKMETEIETLTRDIDDIKTEIERLELKKTEGLQTKIDDITTKIEQLQLKETEGLQAKIEDINSRINDLIQQKELISNVRIAQEPEVSIYPVKPKKKLNVLLAAFGGLFLFTFLAFFIEYLKNARKISGGRPF